MNYYSDFVISFGLMLILMSVAVSWAFKASSVGMVWKLALPVALIAGACHTPSAINEMLGLPVNATFGALPEHAELIAFRLIDDEKRVDLWLQSGEVPRAYQAPMDANMKHVLKTAQMELQSGRPVYMRRRVQKLDAKPGESATLAPWDRQEKTDYELVPSVDLLPAKP